VVTERSQRLSTEELTGFQKPRENMVRSAGRKRKKGSASHPQWGEGGGRLYGGTASTEAPKGGRQTLLQVKKKKHQVE